MTPIDKFALLLAEAAVVVFSGAGHQQPSPAFPTFRSSRGVWSKLQADLFSGFRRVGRSAQGGVASGVSRIRDGWNHAQPNSRVMSRSRSGRCAGKVARRDPTDDNTAQISGVPDEQTIELHGNATYASVCNADVRIELSVIEVEFRRTGTVGPAAARHHQSATISFVNRCRISSDATPRPSRRNSDDLFIVLGSSLVVFPAATSRVAAKHHGAAAARNRPREPTRRRAGRRRDPRRHRRYAYGGAGSS